MAKYEIGQYVGLRHRFWSKLTEQDAELVGRIQHIGKGKDGSFYQIYSPVTPKDCEENYFCRRESEIWELSEGKIMEFVLANGISKA